MDQADVVYRLVVCQLLLGLQVVRGGGTVVCKVFDTHTTHMATLLLQLSALCTQLALVKPITR
jgi:hypothetical protein